MNNKINLCTSIFAFGLISLFSFKSAVAGNTMYWVCGSGIWDTLCWSVGTSSGTATAAQPLNGDYAYLTQSGTSNLVTTYRNSAYPYARLGSLTIDGLGTGTMTLSQETYNDPLQSAEESIGLKGLHIQSVGSNSTGMLGVGGYYSLSGSGRLVASNWENITGVFQQGGGINNAGIIYVGSTVGSGTYNLTAGSLTAAVEYVQGSGTFIQTGGINTVTNFLNMNGGSYLLSGGNFSANNVTIGGYGYPMYVYPTFVQTGGTSTINGNLTLGSCVSQAGSYTLSNGTLSVAGGILRDTCGGAGILKMDGGTLTVGGGNGAITVYDFYVGSTASSNGSHTLSGTGSLMATNEEYIGYSGVGTFHQNNGSNITPILSIGRNTGSNGVYNLNGGTLIAGVVTKGAGTSTLNIDGGILSVGSIFDPINASGGPTVPNNPNVLGGGNGSIDVVNFNVGNAAGSSGNHTLSGIGTITAVNEIIGNFGTGTFTQTGGIHTITNTLSLAASTGSVGTYNLNGGTLNVGQIIRGAGTSAFIWSAGTLNLTASDLTVGTGDLLSATLSLNANKNLSAPNETVAADGTINHAGGANTVANTLTIAANAGNGGFYNLNGGTLHAANITVNNGGTFNFNGGTLAVGQFTGNLTNLGGTLAPGNSPGTTNIVGNYIQSNAGKFAVEIGGTGMGQFDSLHVSGTASLDGTLKVSLFNLGSGLFTPHAGDSFDILTAEQLQGSFSLLALAALDPNFKWEISYLTDAIGTTDVVRLSINAVPIPPAIWLFGSGLIGLFGFKSKSNRRNTLRLRLAYRSTLNVDINKNH